MNTQLTETEAASRDINEDFLDERSKINGHLTKLILSGNYDPQFLYETFFFTNAALIQSLKQYASRVNRNIFADPHIFPEILDSTFLELLDKYDSSLNMTIITFFKKSARWKILNTSRKIMSDTNNIVESTEDNHDLLIDWLTEHPDSSNPESLYELNSYNQFLIDKLALEILKLTSDQQFVITLLFYHEKTYAEISKIMKQSISQVRTLRFNALNRLRGFFINQEF